MDKSAKNKEKNQKQRKRRYHNRNGVPYYGSWWAGVTNPNAVHDHEHFHSGGGTTEMSDGGGAAGGGGEGGGGGVSAKLAAVEPKATLARINQDIDGNVVFGTGILESSGYDPVSGQELMKFNVDGNSIYATRESVQLCPIYDRYPAVPYDEIAFILNGDESFVWVDYYDPDNPVIAVSHREVARNLLGLEPMQLYDMTQGVVRQDKSTLKVFSGDRTEEDISIILDFLSGVDIQNIEWNGDSISSGPTTASIKESVFMEGLRQMGYLGCFYCERPVENVPNLVVSRFTTTEYFVPCCTDCKSGR